METVTLKIDRSMKTFRTIPLKLGSTDINVLKAKKILNSIGYSLMENTQFDAAMQSAIKDFQKRSGLTVDGIIGKDTAAKLNQIAKSPVALLPTITQPTIVISSPSVITKSSTMPTIPEQYETVQEIGFNWKPWAMVAVAIGVFLYVADNHFLGGEK